MEETSLHFNYVYFNSNTYGWKKADAAEYNAICLKDVSEMKGVQVVSCPLEHKSAFLRFLFNVHNSTKLNKRFKMPFRRFWYPFYFRSTDNDNNKDYCFVIANTVPIGYLRYLKKKYPNCKLVKVYKDLLKVSSSVPGYSEEATRQLFDLRYTYDKIEAQKYNMIHYDEIESKIDIQRSNDYPTSDVFFAGKAKDRLSKIYEAYEVFSKAGLKCEFFITGVPSRLQIQRPGITFLKRYMSYRQLLQHAINSRCLLDISQSEAHGFTSRISEAIIYNKRIILDHRAALDSPYYNSNYMQVVDTVSDIDSSFVTREDAVDYHYSGDYSPINFIRKMDLELLNHKSK